MAIHDFSIAPGSCDITGEYTIGSGEHVRHTNMAYATLRTEPRVRGGENGTLLMGKLTEILQKEFGHMSIKVSVTLRYWQACYEINVRYGVYQPRYVVMDFPVHRYEEVSGNFGFPLLIEGLAEELIWHIRKDVRDTMFGKVREETPNEKVPVKKEKAFRKILI